MVNIIPLPKNSCVICILSNLRPAKPLRAYNLLDYDGKYLIRIYVFTKNMAFIIHNITCSCNMVSFIFAASKNK